MWVLRATAAVAIRPWLIPTALRQIWILRRKDWWRQAPYLPVPHQPYIAFRQATAYGDATHPPRVEDVVTYLGWCRAWPQASGAKQ